MTGEEGADLIVQTIIGGFLLGVMILSPIVALVSWIKGNRFSKKNRMDKPLYTIEEEDQRERIKIERNKEIKYHKGRVI